MNKINKIAKNYFPTSLNGDRNYLTGFTLIELLVVIAIIGVLATIAAVGINRARTMAKESRAKNDIAQIYNAIATLGNDTDLWPGQQPVDSVCGGACGSNEICSDGCTFGLSDARSGILATDGNYPGWNGPYMNKMQRDPWNNDYFFDTDYQVDINNEPCGCGGGGCVNAVVVGSYGPDGVGNNVYGCDDIIKIIVR